MKTVEQLLQGKRISGVYTIGSDSRVYEALCLMADKDVGALMVTEAGRLVGVISERDYARKVILHGKSSHDIPVRDIMSNTVVTVRPEQTVDDCMALMTERRIRHLPVVDGGRLTGVLSIGDLVKETISQQQFTIDQLESYIRG
ncbi:MAG: CBS domain-containing protein [Burkholderiales bacterium]